MLAANIGGEDEFYDAGKATGYDWAGGQYRQATKKERKPSKAILDQVVMTTRYSRWRARFLLRNHGKRLQVDQQRMLVADPRKKWSGASAEGL